MKANLTIFEKLDEKTVRKRVVAITADSVTVGTDDTADIQVRKHTVPFILEFKISSDHEWWVLNTTKTRSIRINGTLLSVDAPLSGQDRLEVHGHEILFETREGQNVSSFQFLPQPASDEELWRYCLDENEFDEILINGPKEIFVDYRGHILKAPWQFSSSDFLIATVANQTKVAQGWASWRLHRTLRIQCALPPLIEAPHICIRKAKQNVMSLDELENRNFGRPDEIDFLRMAIEEGNNIIVSGGTSTGKTVLLRSLVEQVPQQERIVLVEEEAETNWPHPHLVAIESGRGQLRQTVVEALRMRPSRLIVSEVRGPEAFDMLQAMNTGHSGSMTTLHANSSREALLRLESLVLSSGVPLTVGAVRKQIAQAIQVIVQLRRDDDGHRRIDHIVKVTGIQNETILLSDPIGLGTRRLKQKVQVGRAKN